MDVIALENVKGVVRRSLPEIMDIHSSNHHRPRWCHCPEIRLAPVARLFDNVRGVLWFIRIPNIFVFVGDRTARAGAAWLSKKAIKKKKS